MESCNEDFNFILLAAHLGTSICVLLVIILVMYTFASKVVSDIKKDINGLPHVCCEKNKLFSYKDHQYPSYVKTNSEFQHNDPDYMSMSRRSTFSHYVDNLGCSALSVLKTKHSQNEWCIYL